MRSVHQNQPTADASLRQWLVDCGGFVHPSLTLVEVAPCGARGIVALRDISLTELEASPMLITVPKVCVVACKLPLHKSPCRHVSYSDHPISQGLHLDNHCACALLRTALQQQQQSAGGLSDQAATAITALDMLSGVQQVSNDQITLVGHLAPVSKSATLTGCLVCSRHAKCDAMWCAVMVVASLCQLSPMYGWVDGWVSCFMLVLV